MTTKTYARVIALLDRPLVGAYTVGREYEVHDEDDNRFTILDDDGDIIGCTWQGDPDAVFERIERDV